MEKIIHINFDKIHEIVCSLVEYREGVSSFHQSEKIANDKPAHVYQYTNIKIPTSYVNGKPFTAELIDKLRDEGFQIAGIATGYDIGFLEILIQDQESQTEEYLMSKDFSSRKKLEDAQMKQSAVHLTWPDVCNIITYIRALEKKLRI